jgi:uncharacterized protein YbgA (DUF1722 family)/uncharacterized protein YbbK (DUF523 family)
MNAVSDRPRLGISSCLLGEHVRYDGGHKRDRFLVDTFGRFVEWVPFCPEIEAGFGAPREPIRLVLAPRPASSGRAGSSTGRVHPSRLEQVAAITESGRDVTAPLARTAARLAREAEEKKLSGFVLKSRSPSCGLERVKAYRNGGASALARRGVFAAALTARLPSLPVEEEGRLSDSRLRENFIERVFAFDRLARLFERRWTIGDLIAFHAVHKLTLMAHSPDAYRRLGRLVAAATGRPRGDVRKEYERTFMDALGIVATRGRHANVLAHMLGYFKHTLDTDACAELVARIEDYRLGRVPLVIPIGLIKHHVRRIGVPYLANQVYLDPHPHELALRNHV